jgi:hypothetical protein
MVKDESEKAQVIRKRQLPEKNCERRKFFQKKIITRKSSLNSSPNAKSKGYSRILQASQGAQDPQDQQRRHQGPIHTNWILLKLRPMGLCHCQMAWVQTDSLQLISMPKKDHQANGMP